jgi:hypothetical protein
MLAKELYKNFNFTEQHRLQLRFEAFNFPEPPELGQPERQYQLRWLRHESSALRPSRTKQYLAALVKSPTRGCWAHLAVPTSCFGSGWMAKLQA